MNKIEVGRFGEEKAVSYLESLNYKIITRNFLCKQGEIDVIAKDGNEIVFCEVKTRNSLEFGKPVEAVNVFKKIHKNNLQNSFIRFDVIEVYLKNGKVLTNQIRNIFK